MFNTLMESRSTPQRSPAGTVASFILHTGLIAIAVVSTTTSAVAFEKPREQRVRLIETPTAPPKEPEPAPPVKQPVIPIPRGHQILVAPLEVPVEIPAPNLLRPETNPLDFSGEGTPGGRGDGDSTVTSVAEDYTALFNEHSVERAVYALSAVAPRYPELLRSAGVEGTVTVQFVVDTLGRAEMDSFKVLSVTHELFGNAVRAAVAKSRFFPAEAGGRKVRQLVEQPFVFGLGR